MLDWEEKYKRLISKVNSIESKMIPTKLHLRGIVEYFLAKEPCAYDSIVNWFWIASSIESVKFNGTRYDCAYTMCRPAYEYEKEKQKLHLKLINELTLFLYVYSGLESLINDFSLPKCPSHNGKINSAKYFLKENYSKKFNSIPLYSDLVNILRSLIIHSSLSNYEKYFSIDECNDINGVGLKVIYQIRNKLAHGEYQFPEPGAWSSNLPCEPYITKVATRIVLLSIQMILISLNVESFIDLEFHNSEILPSDDYGESVINEFEYLNSLHIKLSYKDELQLELF